MFLSLRGSYAQAGQLQLTQIASLYKLFAMEHTEPTRENFTPEYIGTYGAGCRPAAEGVTVNDPPGLLFMRKYCIAS